MTFTLGRTKVRVTPGAILLPAFCIVAGETRSMLSAIVSLAFHETAHAIAAGNLGMPVALITLYPFGAVMRLDSLLSDGRGEWIVAAAGPIGSLAFAALLSLSRTVLPGGAWIDRLIDANLILAAVNLLPAFPLDGGRIFRAVLCRTVRERAAKTILLSFSGVIVLGMLGAGVYLVLKGVPAWTLFLIPPFLAVSAFSEWRTPDAGIVSRVLQRRADLRNGAAQKAQIVVIGENASVGEALSSFSGSRFTILRVIGASGYRDLTEGDVLDAAARCGAGVSFKSVIFRLTDGK